jgi:hypothetical protein
MDVNVAITSQMHQSWSVLDILAGLQPSWWCIKLSWWMYTVTAPYTDGKARSSSTASVVAGGLP